MIIFQREEVDQAVSVLTVFFVFEGIGDSAGWGFPSGI